MSTFRKVSDDLIFNHTASDVKYLIGDRSLVIQFKADHGGFTTHRVGIHAHLLGSNCDIIVMDACLALTIGLATEQASTKGSSIDSTFIIGARINNISSNSINHNSYVLIVLFNELLFQFHDRDITQVVIFSNPNR